MAADPMVEPITEKIGTVCIVSERAKPWTGAITLSGVHLFGVFTTEEIARKEYGDADPNIDVEFRVIPLWGPSAIAAEAESDCYAEVVKAAAALTTKYPDYMSVAGTPRGYSDHVRGLGSALVALRHKVGESLSHPEQEGTG